MFVQASSIYKRPNIYLINFNLEQTVTLNYVHGSSTSYLPISKISKKKKIRGRERLRPSSWGRDIHWVKSRNVIET